MSEGGGEITRLLGEWRSGHAGVSDELMRLVYSELRKRASVHLRNERQGHTLQTTALINEAYLNLVGKDIEWESRSHFFAIASKAMRRILVDHAKAKNRQKRGGGAVAVSLEEAGTLLMNQEADTDIVALDEALVLLGEFDKRQAQIVELKFFGGFTDDETAGVLGISNATVRRDWKIAKAWLFYKLARDSGE